MTTIATAFVVLDDFLFNIAALAKLPVVGILLFWANGQKGVEFLELSGNPQAGSLSISHIEVSNSMAVGAQDDAFSDFFLDPV
jgi:hypothetical protein